jgi:hypothetical protein
MNPAPQRYGVPHTAELGFFWGQPIYSFGKPDKLCRFTGAEATFANEIGAALKRHAMGTVLFPL